VDGSDLDAQLVRYSERLRTYRDRMLHVDWRNRAILLRRTEKKWNFDLAFLWRDDEDKIEEALSKAVRSQGSLCLLRDSDLSEEAQAIRAHLVQLERSARMVFEETGVRDFYIGFPFIVGRVSQDNYVRAPLLLFPVRLERRRQGICGWYLAIEEDAEPIVNRALVAAMRKAGGVSLNDDLQNSVDDLLENAPKERVAAHLILGMQGILRHAGMDLRDAEAFEIAKPLQPLSADDIARLGEDKLHLEGMPIVGSFPQGSTAIYRDYEDLIARAEGGDTDQGIIDELLESSELRSSATEVAGPIVIDTVPDREINFALPTDSSQDTVILEAQRSECTVVRGPPGTGKSQVIVNLVTNALAKGQKILVVCQKRAALDVVHQRLGRSGLADAVILLHDARGDRQAVYGILAKRAEGDPPARDERLEREFEETSKRIDDTIAQLNALVEPTWKEQFGGVRLQELYSAAEPNYATKMQLGNIPTRLTKQSLNELLEKLPNLQIGHYRFDSPTYPLQKRRSFSTLDANARFEMEATLARMTSLSSTNAMLLGSIEQQQAALASIPDYEALRSKTLRFLSGRWRRANRMMRQISALYPNDPRLVTTAQVAAALGQGRELLASLQEASKFLRPEGVDEMRALLRSPDALRTRCEAMRAAISEFDAVQEYDRLVLSLDHVGLELFDNCARALRIDESSWAKTVEQEIVARWISSIESENPQLSGDPFQRYLELKFRLEDLTKKRMELFRRRLMLRILEDARKKELPPGEHHPNKRPETEWNKLLAEFMKKRRVKPVRKLVEDYPFQMMRVCPCWLVSPEAASEVLPLTRGLFDLVVFDESSQLAVERALPCIYRGKRIVIAGDEKQLRPFDLFRSKDEDEELDEVTEAESLLVLSMRVFTPRYLSWHYRSRFQELIDFSNHAFYDGNLEIAANVQRTFPVPPIEYVRVKGAWDERTNAVEASKTVDIVETLLADGEKKGKMPSVGVITFNEPQRDLIEDLVDERRNSNAEFERLYAAATASDRNLDDRPFIKNIENVQGDERDVIIFSVAYAPDAAGKFRVQFGSLSQEGGENRLNVAVTRAREKVIMIASFDPSALPVDESKNLGPKRLKEYLAYAKAVSDAKKDEVQNLLEDLNPLPKTPPQPTLTSLQKPLEQQLKEALQAKGYTVDAAIGFSGYRLDLAIVDPKDSSRYALGVECDGASFHAARSARERDVVRPKFFEERGWQLDRVWSRNWWRGREKEIERLVSRVGASSAAATSSPPLVETRVGVLEKQNKDLVAPKLDATELQEDVPESLADELPGAAFDAGKDDKSMKFIFFTQMQKGQGMLEVHAAESILDWAEEAGMKFWWREFHGVTTVTPYLKHNDLAHWFFSLRADGNLDLHFQYLKAPFDSIEMRLRLLRRMNMITNVEIPEDYQNKVRAIRLKWISGERSVGEFIAAMEWYLNEVRRS